jgi:hypothetical protein
MPTAENNEIPLDAAARPGLGKNQALSTSIEAQMNRSATRTAAPARAALVLSGVVVCVVMHVAS